MGPDELQPRGNPLIDVCPKSTVPSNNQAGTSWLPGGNGGASSTGEILGTGKPRADHRHSTQGLPGVHKVLFYIVKEYVHYATPLMTLLKVDRGSGKKGSEKAVRFEKC